MLHYQKYPVNDSKDDQFLASDEFLNAIKEFENKAKNLKDKTIPGLILVWMMKH